MKDEAEDEKPRELTTLDPPGALSSPAALPSVAAAPPAAQTCGAESEGEKRSVVEAVEEGRQRNVNVELRKAPSWMDDDELPPMM